MEFNHKIDTGYMLREDGALTQMQGIRHRNNERTQRRTLALTIFGPGGDEVMTMNTHTKATQHTLVLVCIILLCSAWLKALGVGERISSPWEFMYE